MLLFNIYLRLIISAGTIIDCLPLTAEVAETNIKVSNSLCYVTHAMVVVVLLFFGLYLSVDRFAGI